MLYRDIIGMDIGELIVALHSLTIRGVHEEGSKRGATIKTNKETEWVLKELETRLDINLDKIREM